MDEAMDMRFVILPQGQNQPEQKTQLYSKI